MENVFTHKSLTKMTDGHEVTLVATRFHGYAAIWWAELQRQR